MVDRRLRTIGGYQSVLNIAECPQGGQHCYRRAKDDDGGEVVRQWRGTMCCMAVYVGMRSTRGEVDVWIWQQRIE